MADNNRTANPSPAGDMKNPDDLPDLGQLPELKIISHSNIVYWWPVWVAGYVIAFLSYVQGREVYIQGGDLDTIHPSENLGVIYVAVLLLVVIFTNVKLRGIYSVAVVLGFAFVAVLLAWAGWWDNILDMIPLLSVRMNIGFYLVISTGLLLIWLAAFFIFDRLTFWRVRPGQMTEERLIGGGEQSYDLRGVLFQKHGEDLFRHIILGLGAGDLMLSTAGARRDQLYIPNVLFVDRKVKAIQKLAAVQPDDLLMQPD